MVRLKQHLDSQPLAFPTTQGQLIKQARGARTQTAFARDLNVSRSCLSRYESEDLGAPTNVINHCLSAIAAQLSGALDNCDPLDSALRFSRATTLHLEAATKGSR